MNSSKILVRVIERIFPEKVAEIRKTSHDKRAAMQLMLDVNRELRMNKHGVDEINARMRPMLKRYERGNYSGMGNVIPSIY